MSDHGGNPFGPSGQADQSDAESGSVDTIQSGDPGEPDYAALRFAAAGGARAPSDAIAASDGSSAAGATSDPEDGDAGVSVLGSSVPLYSGFLLLTGDDLGLDGSEGAEGWSYAPDALGDAAVSADSLSGTAASDVTNASVGSNGATGAQLRQAIEDVGLTETGAGITVGVLSDSFNALGGAAADEADGALPSTVDVLKDDTARGETDEGRAMLQIVHDVASGASLDFYTADFSEQDFANGILALAAAGCKVICDDVGYFDEPMFQNGVVAQAIETVESEGVVYVTAAGNDAENGYQAAWTPISGTFAGRQLNDAESFAGSLTQTITLGPTDGYQAYLLMQWDQPYGAATSDLEMMVFQNGRLVGTATNASSGEPDNPWLGYTFTRSGTYQVAIVNLSGPDPGLIKEVAEGDGLEFTISGANTGTVYGHAETPDAIAVGAVSAADTPAFGVNPAESESFSSSGAGTELLFADNGTALSTPEDLSPVALSGVDDVNTTVSDLTDFYGTSAATPTIAGTVALMLQADPSLTPAEVKQILEQTALTMADPSVSGAGLVDAAAAVEEAQLDAQSGHVAPSVGVQNVSVVENASIAASSMIASVSNPSGDTIADYVFIDEGGDNGYFTVNGVAQADNQQIEVAAGDLSTVAYVGGPAAGSETLEVAVYDSTTSSDSAFSSLTATTTAPPPAPSALSFAVAADDGTSGDTFTVAGKGAAGDTVTLFDGATAIGTAVVGSKGTWSITTANPLAIGAHTLTASEVDGTGGQSAPSRAQVLSIASATPNGVTFTGTAGKDIFTGGPGNDIFEFWVGALAATDIVVGGGGSDELLMTSAGTVNAEGVSGVETYKLANGGANTLTLADANFAGVTGDTITVDGGKSGNTINASAVSAADSVVLVGGAGTDALTGGAGNDVFKFSAANLGAADTVVGGGGSDELLMTSAGTIAAGGVSGVGTYILANSGANTLTLTNANFTGVTGDTITVDGGKSGGTIDASAVTGTDSVVLVGIGHGANAFTVGQDATMTGGSGTNLFAFTTPGTLAMPDTNTITNFAPKNDTIAFSDAGFDLGLSGASSTPTALPSTLFTSNSTGSFTSADQRFAYNTTTGALNYDSEGNTGGSAVQLVATLTGHPKLTAGDLFFVS